MNDDYLIDPLPRRWTTRIDGVAVNARERDTTTTTIKTTTMNGRRTGTNKISRDATARGRSTTTTTTTKGRAPSGGVTIKKQPKTKTKTKTTSGDGQGTTTTTTTTGRDVNERRDGEDDVERDEQTTIDGADDEERQGQRRGETTYARWVDDGASAREIELLAELRRKLDDDPEQYANIQHSESILHDIGAQIEITFKSVGTQTDAGQCVDGEAQCRDEIFRDVEEGAHDSSAFTASLRAALKECEHALLVQSVYDPLDDEFVFLESAQK